MASKTHRGAPRSLALFFVMVMGLSLVVAVPGTAIAADFGQVEVCVDGNDDFEFLVEVGAPDSWDFDFRIGADTDPFFEHTHRFNVDFNNGGDITSTPVVETVGQPELHRWAEGEVEDFELTSIQDGAAWQLTGTLPPGDHPLEDGDEVWGVSVQTDGSVGAESGALTVEACDEPPTTATEEIDFEITEEDEVPFYPFNVVAEGTISVWLRWGGDSELTVDLHGRRRPELADPTAPYAQATGTGWVELSYDVTEEDLARGPGWRLVIRDSSGDFDAVGVGSLSYPFDAEEHERFEAERIQLRSGDLWPSLAHTADFESQLAGQADGLYGIISLSGPCDCREQRLLREVGFHQQSYLPGHDAVGFVETGADRDDPRIAGLVQFLTPLEPEDKIEPNLAVGNLTHFVMPDVDGEPIDYVRNPDGTLNLTVQFHEDTEQDAIGAVLAAHTTDAEALGATEYRVDIEQGEVLPLAENPEVEWIEDGPLPPLHELEDTRGMHGVDDVHQVQTDDGDIVTGGDGLPVYEGYAGAGTTVAVREGGRIDATHPDLANVVNPAAPGGDEFFASSHKTRVSGIAAGSGRNSDGEDSDGEPHTDTNDNPHNWPPFRNRGVAPEASLFDAWSGWGNDAVYSAIVDNAADVSNHSIAIEPDGEYDAQNRRIDRQIRGGARTVLGELVPRRLAFLSAGNGGGNRPQYGRQPGLFSMTKQMKNAVLVGNWCGWGCSTHDWAGVDGRLARGSSMGPAHDGRLMPTLVAHGSFVWAPDTAIEGDDEDDEDLPGDTYRRGVGTSLASPAAAGTAALLLEAWQETYAEPLGTHIDDEPPLPSTLRAVLVQSAIDIESDNVRNATSVDVDADSDPDTGHGEDGVVRATAGPDYATGFGLMDAEAAVDLLTDHRTEGDINVPNRVTQGAVGQEGVAEYEFAVTDATDEVKVTLAWDDVESATQSVATNRTLVNDLDLELVSPSGEVFYPWQLGHRVVDADGNPIPPEAQTPGTEVEVEITGPRPAEETTTFTFEEEDDDGEPVEVEEDYFQEYVPQDVWDEGGDWVARRGRDRLNNIEQVLVPSEGMETGRWTARVVGFDVRTDTQSFSLVGMPYPDLPDISVSAGDQFGLPGFDEETSFTWQVENTGNADADTGVDYRILLSEDFRITGDEVVLDDTSGPGSLTASQINDGAEITSTIEITQADADAVLEGTGNTIDDLLANDVLLLLEVDPIDQNDLLEHNEVNVVPLSPGRPVDVVVVYDRSGSMNWEVPTSLGTQRKRDILENSSGLFFDLMRLGAGDRLGIASFSGNISRDRDLNEVDESNIDDFRGVSGELTYSGLTDIRGGLEEGLDMLPAAGDDERRRVAVLFSDGADNTGDDPSDQAFLDRFADEDVRVFSVGFGTDGGASYAGIDTALLERLGDANAGGFARVTDRATDLDKFFVDALGGAIEWPTVLDPVGDVGAGETHEVEVGVTEEDGTAVFVLTWDDPAGDLDLSVETPSGAVIDADRAASLADSVEHLAEDAHEILTVQLPAGTGSDVDHEGTWRMRITNPGEQTVTYSASALARSTLTGDVEVADPDGDQHEAGEPFSFDVGVSGRRGAPVDHATVTVYPRVPLVGVGDVLASAGLTQAEIDAVPDDFDGDENSPVEQMVIALGDRLGTNPIPLVDEEPFTLSGDGPGAYAGMFADTGVPGPHTFTVRSDFRTENCADSTREQAETREVGITVDPATTDLELTAAGSGHFVLDVTPRDGLGNYVGPGRGAEIETQASGTLVPETELRDELDGSYQQIFRSTDSGTGVVEVTALDVELPPQVVDTSVPFTLDAIPGGGSSSDPTTVTIRPFGGTIDPSQITSVQLVGASFTMGEIAATPQTVLREVEADDVVYDPDSGTISATVPSDIEPGTYRVRLVSDDGAAGAPSGLASFTVVEEGHDPDGLRSVLGQLDAAAADGSTDALRDLLQGLRSLPTGTFLDAAHRAAATQAVLTALLDADATLDTGLVRRVLERGQVDARFFDAGPIETPSGEDITVDLGNGVSVTYDSVTAPGDSRLHVQPGPPEVDPSRRGSPHVAYDITTSADFASAEVEVQWQPGTFDDESDLRLFHLEDRTWRDVTDAVDTATNTITGTVSDFSLFVVVEGGDPLGEPATPSAATDVSAVPGDEQAVVSWNPPADSGAGPVTSYTIIAEPGGVVEQVDGGTTEATVSGLPNGVSHTFTVRASNAEGDGPRSEPSAPVIPHDGAQRFPDVPLDHLFFTEIAWMADTGITTGFADGTFRPVGEVTRQAMAAFMHRAAGSPYG